MIHFKESCLLLIIVTLCQLAFGSKDVDKIEQSRLILEYNWPNMIKGLKRLPHVVSCNHFYLTRPDGTHAIKSCPDGEGYDFLTRRCKAKELAKCWSKQFKTDLESQFVCPFPWGLYPDIVNCSTFFNCLNGKSFIRKCPVDSLFDKAERKCVDAKRAMCADKTDTVEPGYKCPYTWGFFTYKKDCSKYYECLHRNPSLRSCKRNMLFDNKKRKCLPKTFVECGARLNPYEILELSSSKSDLTTDSILSVDIVSTSSSNYSPITDYSTSKESAQTRGGRTEASKYPNDEYSSQHTTPEEHASPSDSSYLKTDDSLGSITEDNSNSTGSFSDTDSKQIGTSDPSIENISRLTGAFTYTDSKLVGSSDSIIEDKSNSTGSFNDTDSKQIDTLDPSIENISRLTGAFTYTDSKLVGSSDTTIEDTSNSTGSFNDTDSKQIDTLDPSIENISRLTGAFTYTDSKLVGSSDSTIEDKSNSTESFNDTDSKQIGTLDPSIGNISRLMGAFTYTDSKLVGSSDTTIEDTSNSTGSFNDTDSKQIGTLNHKIFHV